MVERALRQAALWDEVKDRLEASAMALSGGQQQRLCIARTIAPSPDVILLDEPTASLDPQGTQRIEELLFELKRDFTIIIVTHNMQQAARVSDTHHLLLSGHHGRDRADPADLHRAAERADRGLHHGKVRMTTSHAPQAVRHRAPTSRWHRGRPRRPPASRGSPAVDVRDFSFSYGPRPALRNLNFAIERKSVTAIIGPSGCGKSTFLRSINRLNDLIPGIRHAGDILVEGTSVFAPGTDLVALRQRVGMVFQRPNPFPKSIFDNVAYGPALNALVTAARPAAIWWSGASGRRRCGTK